MNMQYSVPIRDVAAVSKKRIEPQREASETFNCVGLEHIESHTGRLLPRLRTFGRDIRSTKNVFGPGHILYGKLRPYLNKVHLAEEPGICSTDIFVLECGDLLSSAYLAYLLRSPVFVQQAQALTQGANLPRIERSAFLGIRIPLPTLLEQQRIVRILDGAEELRKLRAKADEHTRELIPAIFHEMFGDPGTNPKEWWSAVASDLFPPHRPGTKCGPFGSALKRHEYVHAGVPVWGINNVQTNRFVEEGALFVTEAKYAELADYSVESGDILISRAGTVGRMCVARPSRRPCIIGSNLIRLAFDSEAVHPEYFTCLFTFFAHRLNLFSHSEGSAYSFINTSVLKHFRFPLPPIDLQRAFAARVEEVRAMQEKQAESRRKLDELFESLLHRAFSGEL